jgi:hypothetical protein
MFFCCFLELPKTQVVTSNIHTPTWDDLVATNVKQLQITILSKWFFFLQSRLQFQFDDFN